MSEEERKFFYREDIFKFLSLDFEFKNNKQYPFCKNVEDLTFSDGSIIIPRKGIEKIVQNKISNIQEDVLDKITMLVQIPFSYIIKENDIKTGIIVRNVSLSFRYDKTYKYGEITKSMEEVCYAIIRNAKATNDFYIIDDYFYEFMSYFVIPNQWGLGATKIISRPHYQLTTNFKEIREDGL